MASEAPGSKMPMTEDGRPDWTTYFLRMAKVASERATCNRAKVGAVLVSDGFILATGYNGAPAGEPHCLNEGCIVEDGHCQRAIHAEVNAIGQAARRGTSTLGARLYIYKENSGSEGINACRECTKVIQAAGIQEVHCGGIDSV